MEDVIKQTYEEMIGIPNIDTNTLEVMYKANRNYFSPELIDLFVKLGNKTSLNFIDLVMYSQVTNLSIVKQFATATSTDDDLYKKWQIVLSEYLKAISFYKKISFITLRNNVLFWLRSKMEQPNLSIMSPKNCKVSIKSTYKPFTGSQASVANDLLVKIHDQINQLRNAQTIAFSYTPRTSSVTVTPTNIMNSIVNKTVNLQLLMNREAMLQNIKISPFLDIVTGSSKK